MTEASPQGSVDIQEAKKSLLTLGRERGYITEAEVVDTIPVGMITPTELEVFFFTLDMMNIELRLSDASAQRDSGMITLLHQLTGNKDKDKDDG